MKYVLVILLSYLFGSVPWALVIGKVFYQTDIRNAGSGNLGATNAGRVLGKKAGISVTLLDGLKAFISMAIAMYIEPKAILYAGLACCVGHCFPIFAQFHGGKAVATSFGFLLGISLFLTGHIFWQFFFIIICFFIVLFMFKMVSLASIVSLLIAVIVSIVLKNDISITLALFALWCFVTYRHRDNVTRIINGTERKVTWLDVKK